MTTRTTRLADTVKAVVVHCRRRRTRSLAMVVTRCLSDLGSHVLLVRNLESCVAVCGFTRCQETDDVVSSFAPHSHPKACSKCYIITQVNGSVSVDLNAQLHWEYTTKATCQALEGSQSHHHFILPCKHSLLVICYDKPGMFLQTACSRTHLKLPDNKLRGLFKVEIQGKGYCTKKPFSLSEHHIAS